MAIVTSTFVPTYQGLSAADFVRPAPATREACFPFNVAGRLPFYRARNAIYHLFTALVDTEPAPDGARARLQQRQRDPGHARRRRADPVLPGRPADADRSGDGRAAVRAAQPGSPLRHSLRRLAAADAGARRPLPPPRHAARRGLRALAAQRDAQTGRSARSATGRSSVSTRRCRCRTARCSCRTRTRLEALERLPLRHAGSASVLGRTAELLVQRIRGRANRVGAALQVVKRGMGRAAGALDVRRANVGDIGFNLDEVDLAMSGVSARLLERLDFDDIRRRRVENYRLLERRSIPPCARVFSDAARRRVPALLPDPRARQARRRPRAAAARRRRARVLEREHGVGRRDGTGRALPAPARPRASDSPGPDAAAHRARGARGVRAVTQAGRVMTPLTQAVRSPHATPAHAIRVEAIDTAWGLTTLRPQWNALLRASAADGPFLTWEWLHAWWTHLAGAVVAQADRRARRRRADRHRAVPGRAARGALVLPARVPRHRPRRLRLSRSDRPARPRRRCDSRHRRFLKTQRLTLRLDHLPADVAGRPPRGAARGRRMDRVHHARRRLPAHSTGRPHVGFVSWRRSAPRIAPTCAGGCAASSSSSRRASSS